MKGFKINKKKALKLIELIDKNEGNCPCAVIKDDTTLCPCDNFIKDKTCVCGMYEKIKGDEKDVK